MAKKEIGYGDKVTGGIPKDVHEQQWWFDDANEVKDTINHNSTELYDRTDGNIPHQVIPAKVIWANLSATVQEQDLIWTAVNADLTTIVKHNHDLIFRTVRRVYGQVGAIKTYDVYETYWRLRDKLTVIGGSNVSLGSGNTQLNSTNGIMTFAGRKITKVVDGVIQEGGFTVDFGATGATPIEDSVNSGASYETGKGLFLFKGNDGTDDYLYIYNGVEEKIGSGSGVTTSATDFSILSEGTSDSPPTDGQTIKLQGDTGEGEFPLAIDFIGADVDTDGSNGYAVVRINEKTEKIIAGYLFNGTAFDEYRKNDATATGTPTYVDGVGDSNAIRLNGTSQYLSIPYTSQLAFVDADGDLPFEIEVYVKFSATGVSQSIVNKEDEETTFEYSLVVGGDDLIAFRLRTDNSNRIGIKGATVITTGVWYRIQAGYSGNKDVEGMYLKIDGLLDTPFVQDVVGNYTGMTNHSLPVDIGRIDRSSLPSYLSGDIEYVLFKNDIEKATEYDKNVASGALLTNDIDRVFLFVTDGNSLTDGQDSNTGYDYPNQFINMPAFGSNGSTIVNKSVGGQTTPQMEADASTDIDPLLLRNNGVLLAWECRNDLVVNSATVETAYNNMVTYCTNRRAAGWKVIVATITPSWTATYKGDSTAVGYALLESDRNAVNKLLLDNWASFADGICDLTKYPEINTFGKNEQDGYVFSATRPIVSANGLYSDGTHFTDSGYRLIALAFYKSVLKYIYK